MSSKDDKKIIVNSSDINQFKEMLDSFNNDLSQLNQKFIVISDCKFFNNIYIIFFYLDFKNKFVDRVSNEEYYYNDKV